ncbi:MAG: hypothetical protein EOO40_00870 [Deltaproteobacteria bacterium]|nr:MAG: hypothetical protein EOO40_00870 [Deltaproteobacteria bacterium]
MQDFVDKFLRGAARSATQDLRTSVRHFAAMLAEPDWHTRVIALKDCTVRITRADMQKLTSALRAMVLARLNAGAKD